jgi:hypothetical protein
MNAALMRVDSRYTVFRGLCGDSYCQETGEHKHEDCPECGRVLLPAFANTFSCNTCRRVLRSAGFYVTPDEPTYVDLQERLDELTARPGVCGHGHRTLPVVLWDCPECVRTRVETLTSAVTELLEVMERSGVTGVSGDEWEWAVEQARDAIGFAREVPA